MLKLRNDIFHLCAKFDDSILILSRSKRYHWKEDHARPGWTTSIRVQDSKSQSDRQRTEIKGESTLYVHGVANPKLGSRTTKEQNRTKPRWQPRTFL